MKTPLSTAMLRALGGGPRLWHRLGTHSARLDFANQANALITVLRVVLSLRAMVVNPSAS
jgi:hypothetical protein